MLALAILVSFQNGMKGVQAAAANSDIDPALSIFGLGGLYFALAIWLFVTTSGRGATSPLRRLFVIIDQGIRLLRSALPFRRRESNRS